MSKLTKETVTEARVQVALDEIQKAQNALDAACRAISSIVGLAQAHRFISVESGRVKSLWYRLDSTMGRLRGSGKPPKLDREPDERYDAEYVRMAGGRKALGDAVD